jgi:hypothetical protein
MNALTRQGSPVHRADQQVGQSQISFVGSWLWHDRLDSWQIDWIQAQSVDPGHGSFRQPKDSVKSA